MEKYTRYDAEQQEWAETLKYVHSQWSRAITLLGGRSDLVDESFEKILAEYESGGGRAYHNMRHIERMLRTIGKVEHLVQNLGSILAAAVLHDVKYDTSSKTNEQDSAEFAGLILTHLEVKEADIAESQRLISVTEKHKPVSEDIDGRILTDADFEILGSPHPVYRKYCSGIYQEYVVNGPVTNQQFKVGRGGYLDDFISRIKSDTLFSIPEIRDELQDQAHFNITWEKEQLEAENYSLFLD